MVSVQGLRFSRVSVFSLLLSKDEGLRFSLGFSVKGFGSVGCRVLRNQTRTDTPEASSRV